jgi:UMF1 family MFS transporter
VSSAASADTADGALVRQRRGWYLYGWASQTFPTLVTTVFMSRYLTSVAENAVGKHPMRWPSSATAARSS